MNILFLTTHLNSGGITSYLYLLTKGMVNKGHSVFVISGGGERTQEFKDLGAEVVSINIKTRSELNPKIYTALLFLSKYVERNNIHVIHAQTRVTQVMGQWLKWYEGIPLITTCHGYFKTRWFRKVFPCWGDKSIAISEAVKKHLTKDFNVRPKKVSLIRSGIDLNGFVPLSEEQQQTKRKELGLSEGPLIGIIARLSDVKGPDILITAMADVVKQRPDAQLAMVGEGKMEDECRNLVEELSLTKQIKFFPTTQDTVEFLSLFDVFVMPSRKEGLGLSVMEAQAMGLPVVASNIGGIPDLIEDGQTGFLVEPENVTDLAETIIKVLNDSALMADVGTRAKERAFKDYSFETMVDRTLGVYRAEYKL